MPRPSSHPSPSNRGFRPWLFPHGLPAAILAITVVAATVVTVTVVAATLSACGRSKVSLVSAASNDAPLVIRNVDVLDVEAGRIVVDRDVRLLHGRIAEIAEGGTALRTVGTRELDGRGGTLLPGLIDAHGHVGHGYGPAWEFSLPDPMRNLQAYLYCGVTTVLDPADTLSLAFDRRDRVHDGSILGPTIFTAGPVITSKGGHPVALLNSLAPWWIRWYLRGQVALQADNPVRARAAVADIDGRGADIIKVMVDSLPPSAPRLDMETLRAVVEEAHARDLQVVAHVGSTADALDAGRAGVDAWMHTVYKERIPDAAIDTLAAFEIPMVATLGVFEAYASLHTGRWPPLQLERETIAAEILTAFSEPVPDTLVQELRDYVVELASYQPYWADNIARLRAAGVTVLAGSDMQSGVFPGSGLHRELGFLQEAGMTPLQAITAATLGPARFIEQRQDPSFGRIAVGTRADLLLVDGDPTQSLQALQDIRAVILKGAVLERSALPGTRPTA